MHAETTPITMPSDPMPVTAIELRWVKSTRKALERLRAKADELQARLRAREADIVGRIEAGAAVDGKARVVARRRQSISWFTVCRRELGHEFVEAERFAWPAAMYKELLLR